MQLDVRRERELLPLTDSLASRIRWRYGDYEAILRAELELMLQGQDGERHRRHLWRALQTISNADGKEV